MTTVDPKRGGSAKKPKVRLFRLRPKLRQKMGAVRGADGETGAVSEEALKRALTEMKKAEEDYPDWVRQSLSELADEMKAAWAKPVTERTAHIRKIGLMAHELKGQGGTFGYPLISMFGKSLYDFTQTDVRITDNHMEIVKAHVDVMRAVISDRVAGSGGGLGKDLMTGLEQAIEKYSDKIRWG